MRTTSLPGTAREHVGIRTFGYVFVPPTLVVLAVGVVSVATGHSVATFTMEPTTALGGAPYVGAVSSLGCYGWAAAIGIFLLGACLLYDGMRRRDAAFLACSALITGYLLADDAFTLHEAVLPAVGIPEFVTYLAILAVIGAYAAAFHAEIRRSAWLFLGLAVLLLGGSVAVDAAWEILEPARGANIEQLAEDAAKLLGISSWVGYAALSVRGLVRARFAGTGGR